MQRTITIDSLPDAFWNVDDDVDVIVFSACVWEPEFVVAQTTRSHNPISWIHDGTNSFRNPPVTHFLNIVLIQ